MACNCVSAVSIRVSYLARRVCSVCDSSSSRKLVSALAKSVSTSFIWFISAASLVVILVRFASSAGNLAAICFLVVAISRSNSACMDLILASPVGVDGLDWLDWAPWYCVNS